LKATCKAAAEENRKLKIVQKCVGDDGCDHDFVEIARDNDAITKALADNKAQIVAGTAWLWARPELAGAVDVLFVDEAGQMSPANVLAASPSANSIVLLGDPQQLDQPQRGVHPTGAAASVLSHLLDDQKTITPDRGLFLAESWRLHPDICVFTSDVFYERRLTSRPENANQRLNVAGPIGGTGLRFVPVKHDANQSDSPEEVLKVAELVELLLRGLDVLLLLLVTRRALGVLAVLLLFETLVAELLPLHALLVLQAAVGLVVDETGLLERVAQVAHGSLRRRHCVPVERDGRV
jgi:uncharacterized protein